MKTPVILYRRGMNPDEDQDELDAIKRAGLKYVYQRTEVEPNSLVIGRYSVLPFYKELELDIQNRKSALVNSYRQHAFIADMKEWCYVLGDLTPRLYPRLQDIPDNGPFVLKGQTNSKKFMWNTHMFAQTKREAGEVWSRLRDDMLLADQEIYVRDFVPLVKLGEGFNGLPISKEFRFFVLGGEVVCGAFYWASHLADIKEVPDVSEVPQSFLKKAIGLIGGYASFYVLDVAQTCDGRWIVVEINDGQMSGLSCNTADALYGGIAKVFSGAGQYRLSQDVT